METTYKVEGMTCDGCVRSVTKAILSVANDAKVSADFRADTVTVSGIAEPILRQAIEDAGFDFIGKV